MDPKNSKIKNRNGKKGDGTFCDGGFLYHRKGGTDEKTGETYVSIPFKLSGDRVTGASAVILRFCFNFVRLNEDRKEVSGGLNIILSRRLLRRELR